MNAERKEAMAKQINLGQTFMSPLTLSHFAVTYWFVGFSWIREEAYISAYISKYLKT